MPTVRLTIVKSGAEHFAIRTFPHDTNPGPARNEIFHLEKEIDNDADRIALEDEARAKARELGIAKVINLDPGAH